MRVDGSKVPGPHATWAPSRAATKPSTSTGCHVSYFHMWSEKGHSLQGQVGPAADFVCFYPMFSSPKASDI